MGAVISHSSRITFFFWDARCLAIFTAVTVLPLPGLPQTARMPPWASTGCTASASSPPRLKMLAFLKFIARRLAFSARFSALAFIGLVCVVRLIFRLGIEFLDQSVLRFNESG